jgi:hypothetical protein
MPLVLLSVAEGGVETDAGTLYAQTVGADKTDAVLFRCGHHRFFHYHALGANLAEAGRQHDGVANAALATFLHDLRHGPCRGGDQGEFWRFRQFVGMGVATLAKNLVMFGVDRVNLSAVSGGAQIPEQDACD